MLELSEKPEISLPRILVFESSGMWGYGPVYDLDQLSSNWINISERHMDISPRSECKLGELTIPKFPGYHDWADLDYDIISDEQPDTYPHRGKVGQYLQARYQSVAQPLRSAGLLTEVEERVIEIDLHRDESMSIITDKAKYKSIFHALLTIGHQDTELDDQILKWQTHAESYDRVDVLKSPYPMRRVMEYQKDGKHSAIGIRGFGLAMIDVVRAIAESRGHFDGVGEDMRYVCLEGRDFLLVPFSLDGLPMVPKPINAVQDARYEVADQMLETLEQTLSDPEKQKRAASADFLVDALLPIIAYIYQRLSNRRGDEALDPADISQIARVWIKDDVKNDAHILSTDLSTAEQIQALVDMSHGRIPITLDYCIGQVWRHCQPTIYKALSYNECSDEVFAQIIALDEKSKRYSYGPPVESMSQLLALARAGVVTFTHVADPEIMLSPYGWKLQTDDEQQIVSMMVDSVLDSPQIVKVCTDLVTDLLEDDIIHPVHDDYGVTTREDAYIISADDRPVPLALLGRLAKGTVIGVDAILECFGARAENWASAAVKQLQRAS